MGWKEDIRWIGKATRVPSDCTEWQLSKSNSIVEWKSIGAD